MSEKNIEIDIEEDILEKFGYVSQQQGRSMNSQVLHLINEYIAKFEREYGDVSGDVPPPDVNVKPTKTK